MAEKIQKIHFFAGTDHKSDRDPQKSVFFYFLGHLKAKWAEIWSENRFLKMIRGDFDFGHFRPFLAELRHFIFSWKLPKKNFDGSGGT